MAEIKAKGAKVTERQGAKSKRHVSMLNPSKECVLAKGELRGSPGQKRALLEKNTSGQTEKREKAD